MRRVVLVDDERLARRELRSLLRAHPDVEVVGEAETLTTAEEVIRATEADGVFLDIQLGEENGFDLLPRLDPEVSVVFVTAFDRYAVRAFEAHALDYLMKPVSAERLARAIERLVRPEVGRTDRTDPLGYDDFLFLRAEGRMHFIRVAEIKAVRADQGPCQDNGSGIDLGGSLLLPLTAAPDHVRPPRLLPPAPLSSRDHLPCGLAVSSLCAQLPRCRGAPLRARDRGQL